VVNQSVDYSNLQSLANAQEGGEESFQHDPTTAKKVKKGPHHMSVDSHINNINHIYQQKQESIQ
jgi:hypothetical protein